jgi:hypothetical protein
VADKGNYLASDSRITSEAFSAIESSRKEERASIPSCHQKRVIEFPPASEFRFPNSGIPENRKLA